MQGSSSSVVVVGLVEVDGGTVTVLLVGFVDVADEEGLIEELDELLGGIVSVELAEGGCEVEVVGCTEDDP